MPTGYYFLFYIVEIKSYVNQRSTCG